MEQVNLFSFRGDIGGKLTEANGFKTRYSQEDLGVDYTTVYLDDNAKNAHTAQSAIPSFYNITRSMSQEERPCFIGINDNQTVAELPNDDGTMQVCKVTIKNDKFDVRCAIASPDGTLTPWTGHRGTVILTALMPHFFNDPTNEARNAFNALDTCCYDKEADDYGYEIIRERFEKSLIWFSSNVYYRQKNHKLPAELELPVTVKELRQADLKKAYKQIFCGTAKIFKEERATTAYDTCKTHPFGEYALGAIDKWTEKEKELIPTLPESLVIEDWILNMAKSIKASSRFPKSFRNILLQGPAGTGKSTAAKVLAYLLGKPFVVFSCNPDTDITDLTYTMIPCEGVRDMSTEDLPSFDDVEFDFEGSYEKLFGKKPDENACPTDCYSALSEEIVKRSSASKGNFKLATSVLLEAVKNGWVVEIQEPTILKRSSVFAGINKMLDSAYDGASYTMPSGEIIKRDPNCVIIMTTNKDYEGCNAIQQSVLSRADIVKNVPVSKADQLKARVQAQSGVTEKEIPEATILKMAKIICDIDDSCRKDEITDGVCGPRELLNWVQNLVIETDGNAKNIANDLLIKTAWSTVVLKASQNEEDQEEILVKCFRKEFTREEIEEGRRMAEWSF